MILASILCLLFCKNMMQSSSRSNW